MDEQRPTRPISEDERRWKSEWIPGKDSQPGPFHEGASGYRPSAGLVDALNMAVELRSPLLITGQPGTGKTTAAYWAALQMEVRADRVFHQTIRSETTSRDVRYEFDAVRYFRDAQAQAFMHRSGAPPADAQKGPPSKKTYIQERALWKAFEASQKDRVVIVFDEIDKAPRDFANDLLHELDTMAFEVPERDTDGKSYPITATRDNVLLWVCTSNGERDLPDAFLRRCLHFRLILDTHQIRKAVDAQLTRGLKRSKVDPDLIEAALMRFHQIVPLTRRHVPSLAEALLWIRALHERKVSARELETLALPALPGLSALIKSDDDWDALSEMRDGALLSARPFNGE